MPVGRAVQVRGIPATLKAYKEAGIPSFAVCYLKDVNFKCETSDIVEGGSMLMAWLKKLEVSNSQAFYQLRLYEDLNGKKIKSSTAWDISFNFTISEERIYEAGSYQGNNSQMLQLMQELVEAKQENIKLIQEQNETDNEEDGKTVEKTNIRDDLIRQLLPVVAKIGEKIGDALFETKKHSGIAGVSVSGELQNSLERISKRLPSTMTVEQMLRKLADFADQKPTQFQMYLNMI